MRLFSAVGLAVVAGLLYAIALGAGGWEFREPPGSSCQAHVPAGWNDERTSVVLTEWSSLPPRTVCDITNQATGQTVTWDTGNGSVGWLVASGAVGLAAVLMLGAAMVTRVREPVA